MSAGSFYSSLRLILPTTIKKRRGGKGVNSSGTRGEHAYVRRTLNSTRERAFNPGERDARLVSSPFVIFRESSRNIFNKITHGTSVQYYFREMTCDLRISQRLFLRFGVSSLIFSKLESEASRVIVLVSLYCALVKSLPHIWFLEL